MKKKVNVDTIAREGMEPKGTIVLLTRLAKAVHRRSTEELLGMRLRQFVLLATLRDRAPIPQQELCETLWLDPNNCVLMLNELEDAGFVERRRDQADRRRHVVDITAKGMRALERAEVAQESLEDEVLAGLTLAERATLRRLLLAALEKGAALEKPPALEKESALEKGRSAETAAAASTETGIGS